MSACACARARVCAFADAGTRADARTCVLACDGAHMPVCLTVGMCVRVCVRTCSRECARVMVRMCVYECA